MWFVLCFIVLLSSSQSITAQEKESFAVDNQTEELIDLKDDFSEEDIQALLDTMHITSQEIPKPIFHKPNFLQVAFRKIGLWTLLGLLNAKDYCMQKIKTTFGSFKALRYTL